jgi:hypothetical protein
MEIFIAGYGYSYPKRAHQKYKGDSKGKLCVYTTNQKE